MHPSSAVAPFRSLVGAAIAAPTLLAYNVSPSATLLNQLLAVGLWGVVLIAWPMGPERPGWRSPGLWAAFGLLAVAALWSMEVALPASLGWSALALLAAAAAVAWHGSAEETPSSDAIDAFCTALLAAGVASALISLVQVFAPGWADGTFIARSGLPGRAVGNLRQPNHLSSLLMWALVAWVPLARAGRVAGWRFPAHVAWPLALLLLWAVVLTASRTGIVGVLLLALWGAVDGRLGRRMRVTLVTAPLAYLALWLVMSAWAHATGATFGGEARLAEGDVSGSRWGIWSNTLALIAAHPWTGVGFGQFNFAWTLSPFPGRPVAFFDHTHNLPLQLWVELGIPLGTLVLLGLLWALAQAAVRSWRAQGDVGVGSRAAFMVVLMIGVHSLFEYPLWYAYFLLPAAWAFGYALRRPPGSPAAAEEPVVTVAGSPWPLRAAGVLLLLGSVYALQDYWRVVVIYAPDDASGPLAERIERGQHSLFFGHQADYAAATTTEPPSLAMAAFHTTTHALLDTRLMIAWARAMEESGHRDKASYLAARLKEFRNPASAEFFAACQMPVDDGAPGPFQCEEPPPALGWRDFLPQRP